MNRAAMRRGCSRLRRLTFSSRAWSRNELRLGRSTTLCEFEFARGRIDVHIDGIPLRKIAAEDLRGDWIFDPLLDESLQRAGPILRIVPFFAEQPPGFV